MASLESTIGQDLTSLAQDMKQVMITVFVVVLLSFGNKGRRLPPTVACLKIFLKWKKTQDNTSTAIKLNWQIRKIGWSRLKTTVEATFCHPLKKKLSCWTNGTFESGLRSMWKLLGQITLSLKKFIIIFFLIFEIY